VKKDAHDHAAHEGHEHNERDKDHSGHGHGHGEASGHAGHNHKEGLLGEKTELIFALLSGALLLIGWLISKGDFAALWVPTALYVGAYFFGGYFTVKEAFENLRARRFEIDTLMLVAAAGAAAPGEWGEGALLIFFFSFGQSLEHYAMGRARRAI
jgi:Cd2+/Zn2+-exporting ATPase